MNPLFAIPLAVAWLALALTASAEPLRWSPPELVDPVTLDLGAKSSWQSFKLDKTKDYIVKMPENRPWVGELNLYGGHHVVLIGGEVRIPDEEEDPAFGELNEEGKLKKSRRAVYLHGQTGTIHIEGLLLSGGGLREGFNLDEREETCIVQLQNIRCETVQGSYSGNHADVIQTWGGPARLRIDGFTGYTTYQGFFLLPNQQFEVENGAFRPAEWEFRRVNLVGTDASAYMLWGPGDVPLPVSIDDVWVQPAASKRGNRDAYLWPKPRSTGDTTWVAVQEGVPPGGDFVPASGAGAAGIGYVSPGFEPATFRWTGAAGTAFADAANWLVEQEGGWVAADVPPRNAYGLDTIVFDGEPSVPMPVLPESRALRAIDFRSGGWTLTLADGAALTLIHGSGGHYLGILEDTAIRDRGGNGATNAVVGDGRLLFATGGTFDVGAGSVLALSCVVTNRADAGNLGSANKRSRKTGAGTLVLDGPTPNLAFATKGFLVDAGTLVLAKTTGPAIGPLSMTGGRVECRGPQQILCTSATDAASKEARQTPWQFSGNASVDFGGYAQNTRKLAFGATSADFFAPNGKHDLGDRASATPAPWTGTLENTDGLRLGIINGGNDGIAGGRLVVTPEVAAPVVFDHGLDSVCGRYAQGATARVRFHVGDNPALPYEVVVHGSLFAGNTGNGATYLVVQGVECGGEETFGAVAFDGATTWGGSYAKLDVFATVFANNPDGDALGAPTALAVHAPHGTLRGHGRVTLNTSSARTLDVYGTLAPGSAENPAGTLTLRPSTTGGALETVMHTNAVFRVAADATGALPRVEQKGGTFRLETATDGAPGATLHITGPTAPAEGVVHRILATPAGGLSGDFDAVVADFPDSHRYNVTVTRGDGFVDVRVGRKHSLILLH